MIPTVVITGKAQSGKTLLLTKLVQLSGSNINFVESYSQTITPANNVVAYIVCVDPTNTRSPQEIVPNFESRDKYSGKIYYIITKADIIKDWTAISKLAHNLRKNSLIVW